MIHKPLTGAPPYDAISYTWGNPAKTHKVIVEVHLFPVTATVYDILMERASIWRTRLLWIDSICINQDDLDEKSDQVKMMRDIYRRADRVVISLGSSPDAEIAHRFLGHLMFFHLFYQPTGEQLTTRKPMNEDSPNWLALQHLVGHPYWSRVWVVQEIAVAKAVHIVYGGKYLDWDRLSTIINAFGSAEKGSLIKIMDTIEGPGTPGFFGIGLISRMANIRCDVEKSIIVSFSKIMVDCAWFNATNPRDKVYALQGITAATAEDALVPDYTKTIEEVYVEAARYSLRDEDPFCWFPMAGIASGKRKEGLPSWVLDWTNPPDTFPLSRLGPKGPKFRACADTQPHIASLPNTTTLNIAGILFDTISRVANVPPWHTCNEMRDPALESVDRMLDMPPTEIARHKEALSLATAGPPDPYPNGQTRREAFWRTLICDGAHKARPADPSTGDEYDRMIRINTAMEQFRPSIKRADGLSAAELEKDTHFNIEAMKFLLSVSDSLTSPNPTIRSIAAEMENKIQTFERGDHDVEIPRSMLDALTEGLASGAGDIAEATKGRFGTLLGQTFNTRQFAATERGLMSLVPLGTKKGDEVVLFLGGKTPFILREWEGGW